MGIEFDDPDLEKFAYDSVFIGKGKWRSWSIKRRFQKVIVAFQAITRRESLFPLSGLRFELLAGKRKGHDKKDYDEEYSVRINHKIRIVLSFRGEPTNETIIIIAIEEYHG